MLANVMNAAGAFLMALGGVYIGRHIEGDVSFHAVIALRKRVRELESKLNGNSSY